MCEHEGSRTEAKCEILYLKKKTGFFFVGWNQKYCFKQWLKKTQVLVQP